MNKPKNCVKTKIMNVKIGLNYQTDGMGWVSLRETDVNQTLLNESFKLDKSLIDTATTTDDELLSWKIETR